MFKDHATPKGVADVLVQSVLGHYSAEVQEAWQTFESFEPRQRAATMRAVLMYKPPHPRPVEVAGLLNRMFDLSLRTAGSIELIDGFFVQAVRKFVNDGFTANLPSHELWEEQILRIERSKPSSPTPQFEKMTTQ